MHQQKREFPGRNSMSMVVSVACLSIACPVLAEESAEELAKKLSNPVAALISVPFQLNYDEDIGPNKPRRELAKYGLHSWRVI